jgi:hypothetical protein
MSADATEVVHKQAQLARARAVVTLTSQLVVDLAIL